MKLLASQRGHLGVPAILGITRKEWAFRLFFQGRPIPGGLGDIYQINHVNLKTRYPLAILYYKIQGF